MYTNKVTSIRKKYLHHKSNMLLFLLHFIFTSVFNLSFTQFSFAQNKNKKPFDSEATINLLEKKLAASGENITRSKNSPNINGGNSDNNNDTSAIPLSQLPKLRDSIYKNISEKKFSPEQVNRLLYSLAVIHTRFKVEQLALAGILEEACKYDSQKIPSNLRQVLWEGATKVYAKSTMLSDVTLEKMADCIVVENSDLINISKWNYYRGIISLRKKDLPLALSHFGKVALEAPEYRRAKFASAFILLSQKQIEAAKDMFSVVVSLERTSAESKAGLSSSQVEKLKELGVLALARLHYENGSFLDSLAYYRTLDQDSSLFRESLTEQSWAFFMAGYPNRALGSVYSATSPFYKKFLNADAYFLTSVVHYWLCNYDASRKHLSRFVGHVKSEGDLLRTFMSKMAAKPKNAANLEYTKLLADLQAGVTSTNLGLGQKTLSNLLANESIQVSYESIAQFARRKQSFKPTAQNENYSSRFALYFSAVERMMQEKLGEQIGSHLETSFRDMEKSLNQAKLLYLEILVAKKDAILGKERSVEGQEFVGNEKSFEEAYSSTAQSWSQDKNEFWFDELGSFVFQEKSQCGAGGNAMD